MNATATRLIQESWSIRLTRFLIALFAAMLLGSLSPAHAQTSRTGLKVTIPNGFANLAVEDLHLQSTSGTVRWKRVWNGQEWKFNPQWESLSQSWKNLTGSQASDTTVNFVNILAAPLITSSLSTGGSCWITVDEDWPPASTAAGPLTPLRSTPFNRVLVDGATDYPVPVRVSVDYTSLCPGVVTGSLGLGLVDPEGFRRQNELYLGDNGRYIYDNRTVLIKSAVSALPTADAATLDTQLATGSVTMAPITIAKGFRWSHKSGNWIDYNTQGQVVAYGDNNDNRIWLARDTTGIVRGVVDANGRVLTTLHYTGQLLTEVRDYPIPGNNLDIAARSVKYQYDAGNRLVQVTDVRGNFTRYDYDAANHIIKITDPEGRIEQLAYTGDIVNQRIAPDGTVTNYAFSYDDVNKQFISKIAGPNTISGQRVEDYTYNRAGKLVRTIVNGRIDEEVSYDTATRTEYHNNARGFVTSTTKNEFDQVVRIIYPDTSSQQRNYSAQNLRLTETIDAAGFKTQYSYDNKGNLINITEALGTPQQRLTEMQVNALGQTIQVTRKGRTESGGLVTPDAAWKIDYDAQGQISQTTDPEGHVRHYVYDRTGTLASFTDPLGHATRFEVDAAGNLAKVTDALGRIQSLAYDKVGNLTTFTDARGKQILAAYDAMNRLRQSTNAVGGISKLQYNAQGLPVTATDEDGRTIQAEFDNFQRLTKLSDALGNVTQLGYNIPDGSATGTLGSLSAPTEIKYPTFTQNNRLDQRERPTSQILLNTNRAGTESLTSGKTYDARGLMKSDIDANGKSRYYNYDALSQLSDFSDALGHKTVFRYDARGNLIELTDANSNTHKFEYDRNNRVLKEILPLGQITQYSYDAAGNLAQRTDPNGNQATYGYDAANRLQEIKQYQSGTVLVRTTTYTWDDADNQIAWSDTDATRPLDQQTASGTATYDDANRKTGETVTYPNPAGLPYILSYSYQYSAAGKKTRLTWADGTAIDYGYSLHGELDSVTIPGEGILSVNQFKWMAPASVTFPGGSAQDKSYDGLMNLETLSVKTPAQQSVLDLTNNYGKRQELTSRSRIDTINGSSSTLNGQFSYDDELRLTQSLTDTGTLFSTDTETFTLDAVGNRVAHNKVTGAWTYDGNNRLIEKGLPVLGTQYDYDQAGNLIKKTDFGSITQYVYDTQNRLIEVKDGSGNLVARYGYDILDRRIWKEQYRTRSGSVLVQAIRSYYLYADEGLIAESRQDITLNTDQTVTASVAPAIVTQYGPRPDGLFGTGVLFIKTRNSSGTDTVAYYHHDQLGTPIQATDKNGNVVWSAVYNVFGQAAITTPSATVDKPTISSSLRLPGQIEDSETGFHYNWHRYYEPGLGRYVTGDPIGLWGGVNAYAFAMSSPTRYIDFNGLQRAPTRPMRLPPMPPRIPIPQSNRPPYPQSLPPINRRPVNEIPLSPGQDKELWDNITDYLDELRQDPEEYLSQKRECMVKRGRQDEETKKELEDRAQAPVCTFSDPQGILGPLQGQSVSNPNPSSDVCDAILNDKWP